MQRSAVKGGKISPPPCCAAFIQYVFISLSISSLAVLGDLLRSSADEARDKAQRVLSSTLGLAASAGVVACFLSLLYPERLVQATGMTDPLVVRDLTSLTSSHFKRRRRRL